MPGLGPVAPPPPPAPVEPPAAILPKRKNAGKCPSNCRRPDPRKTPKFGVPGLEGLWDWLAGTRRWGQRSPGKSGG